MRESGTKTIAQARELQNDITTAEGRRKLKRDLIEQQSEREQWSKAQEHMLQVYVKVKIIFFNIFAFVIAEYLDVYDADP